MTTIVLKKARKIGREAFKGLNSLKSIKMYNSCRNLPLNSIQIGDVEIDSSIIQQYSNTIDTIVLCDCLIEIEKGAFENCNSLTTVELPNNIKDIGEEAFQNCKKLSSVKFFSRDTGVPLRNIREGAFCNCSSLILVSLPNDINTIGDGAFRNCNKLERIEIGESITKIGDCAFYECSSLNTIIMKGKNPPILGMSYVFPNLNINIEIPKGSLSSYENGNVWSIYKNRLIEK
jgi:surface antigen bspA-like